MKSLKDKIQEVLDEKLPHWIWNLKPGAMIGVSVNTGKWSTPGTRHWKLERFICVSGKNVVTQNVDFPQVINFQSNPELFIKLEEFEKIEAELLAYREANPHWEDVHM